MSKFWEIKTEDYYCTASELRKCLPELKDTYYEDIVSNLRGSGIFLVRKHLVETPIWIRLTMPFALTFLLLMLITSPIKYMITGSWGYRVEWIANWFRAVGF